jgi:TonB-dependent SusC/RagA subfamily outer membrane receptor
MTKRLLGKISLLVLCVLSAQLSLAQTKSISGKISDDKGNPVPGATIAVKGSQAVAASDSTGAFHLSVGPNAKTLIVSSVGFLGKEIEIGNSTHFEIVLGGQSQSLNDVIVIGYGTAKKGDLTAPITTVNMDDAEKRTTSTPMDALQGSVPGVQVVSNGAPGSSPDVRIRGIGSFNNQNPLYVVDGMFVNDIGFLNANDIAEMSILKDASGAAIYGVRAANGVVLITTKKGI